MNIVFFGSSDFAVPSLAALTKEHRILRVVTQPDRPKGRRPKPAETPVKHYALEHELPIYQPVNANDEESVALLKVLEADMFVVVSFGQILSRMVLDIPRLFCVNLHSSLLPRWRGAAPINWAIICGDTVAGVTVIRMNERMDAGDIILQAETSVSSDDDAVSLKNRLAAMGSEELLKTLDLAKRDKIRFQPQDKSRVSVARKLTKSDGLIDWYEQAVCVYNKVRGMLPWPCAYTRYQGKGLKVLKASVRPEEAEVFCPGTVVEVQKRQGVVIAAGSGRERLLIETIQPEGKKPMTAYDFVLGHRLQERDRFE